MHFNTGSPALLPNISTTMPLRLPSSKLASTASYPFNGQARRTRWLTSAACVLSLATAFRSSAANIWDGGGADANWSSADNWDDNLVPTFPVFLSFGGSAQLLPHNDLSAITVNGIAFLAGANAFNLGGNPISLGGDIDNASTSPQTINLPITATAARTINSPFGDIRINGSLSGLEFFKRGSGTLTLTGAHTYTNRTGVGNNPNGVGMTPSTHQGGGTLVLDFSAAGSPATNLLYNQQATFTTTQELRLADGTVVLKGKDATNNSQQIGQLGISTGFNTVDLMPGVGGKMLFNIGSIALAGGAAQDTNKSSLVNFILPSGVQDATNGVVTNSLNHASGILSPITGNLANLVVNGSSWATNATNSAGGNIIPLPDASYVPSTETTTGNTTQNVDMVTDTTASNQTPWTLRFNNTGVSGPRVLTALTVNSTAALTVGGGGILVTTGMGSNNVTIAGGTLRGSSNRGLFISNYNTGGGRLIIDSNIINNSNGNALTIGGGGFVRLNGNNSYTSGTYVFRGSTLSIAADSALGNGGGSVTVASASTTSSSVTLAAAGPSTGAWVVGASLLGSTISAISGTTITLAGNASADITANTTVAFSTAPALSIDGGTLQADGTFELRRTQPADASGVGGSPTSDRRIGLGGGGGTIEVTSGNTFTVTGAVSSQTTRGFGALRKTGPGTLVLAGNNTYSGGTTVSAGTLRAGSSTALGASGATLTLAAGATLQTNGQNVTVGGLATDAASIIENANAVTGTLIVNSSQNITVPANLRNGSAGLLQLTKQGSGALTLTAANTHGGDTLLSTGAIILANSLALQNSSLNQQVATGGGLVFDASVSSRAFALGGLKNNNSLHTLALENNAATPQPVALTVGGNNRAGAYSGVLSGAGSLTKTGNATLTLSGANTYSGGTTVSSGTLALSGAGTPGSGPVVLAAGSTLDLSLLDSATPALPSSLSGAGTINAGTKTVALPGALSLAGRLDVTGGLSLGTGVDRAFRITGAASRDRLVVTGDLSLDGDLALYTAEGATLAAGQTHDFYDAANVITGLDSVRVNGLALASSSGVWTGSANGLAYTFTEATGELVVSPAATPLTALETWRQTYFGSAADSGPGADANDPDADGLPNLLEYAVGSSPLAASAPASSVALSGGRLALSFQRIADPALTYTVQVSSDLAGAWTTLAVAGNPSTGAANVAGLVTVTDSVSAAAQPRRFLRLVVTR